MAQVPKEESVGTATLNARRRHSSPGRGASFFGIGQIGPGAGGVLVLGLHLRQAAIARGFHGRGGERAVFRRA